MKTFLNACKSLYICIPITFLCSCTINDVGEDTDGPTKKGFPEVTTRSVLISRDAISAEGGGEVLSEGDSKLTGRGVCWSTEPNPTIADNTTSNGTGLGEFTSSITGLKENTRYYLRAYATNEFGTSYGGEIDFFTSKIFSGNVVLSSQAEVNNFGNENYLIVNGDFFIGADGGSDITSLKPLETLNQIRGNLFIGSRNRPNPLLKNLDGLEFLALVRSITFTKYNLRIENNENLENIDGLKGLGLFEGDIWINKNPLLTNLDGLERITKANRIMIINNASLNSLSGLSNIESIAGFQLSSCPLITAIDGWDKIPSSISYITIFDNEKLTDISALSEIERLYSLILKDNPGLVDLSSLSKLEYISERLKIENTGVTNLDAFQSLISVGDVYTPPANPLSERDVEITNNENLNDFCGIKSLLESEDFTGEIRIRQNKYNPSIEDILSGNCNN